MIPYMSGNVNAKLSAVRIIDADELKETEENTNNIENTNKE